MFAKIVLITIIVLIVLWFILILWSAPKIAFKTTTFSGTIRKLIFLSIFLSIASFGIWYIINDNPPVKEQLYHKVIENDIVGPDTIGNVYFIPDSIWYKTHDQ